MQTRVCGAYPRQTSYYGMIEGYKQETELDDSNEEEDSFFSCIKVRKAPDFLSKSGAFMILSEEEHITPGYTVFIETVHANPCRLSFDQSGDGCCLIAKHHTAVV